MNRHRTLLPATAIVIAVLAGTVLAPAAPRAGAVLDVFPTLPWSPVGSFAGQGLGFGAAPAGDVNGDGFGDVLVSTATEDTAQVRALLYLGGPDGPSLVPAWTFTTSEEANPARSAGDVNGDGYADVMVPRPFAAIPNHPGGGKVAIFHGGPNGLPATPSYERFSPTPADNQLFGSAVDYAGDVNGDGYSDIIVGTFAYTQDGIPSRGAAWIFHGGLFGLQAVPAKTLVGTLEPGRFAQAVATAGDVNGDGFDDVIIGAPQAASGFPHGGRVTVHFGSASGIGNTFALLNGTANDALCGSAVSTAGDVNGDGYADVVFGSPGGVDFIGRADIAFGGPAGIASRTPLPSPVNEAQEQWGRVVAPLGDTDGDGNPEFAIAGMNSPFLTGHAFVYSGDGVAGVQQVGELLPPPGAVAFARAIDGSGDVDGDGRNEILVADAAADGGKGRVYLRGRLRPTGVSAVGWPVAAAQAGTRFGNALAIVYGRDFRFFAPTVLIGDPGFDGFGRVTEHVGGWPLGVRSEIDRDVPGTVNFQSLGTTLADAGDFNGDGYGDYVVSSPTLNAGTFQNPISQAGRVDIVFGSPGTQGPPVTLLVGQRAFDRIGGGLTGRGDVNGDGYHDVLIGARQADTATLADAGRAWLVFGGPAPPPPWTIEGSEAGQGLGAGVALLDLDADGYTDVALGSSSPPSGPQLSGKVQVHYGGPAGPSNTPGLVLTPPVPSVSYGATVAALGDVNGDGVADLGVGAPLENNRGIARIYAGSLGRSQSQIPMTFYAGTQDGGRLGETMAGGGDFDGDGFGDLAIGQPGFDGMGPDVGRALLYFGALHVPESTPASTLQPTETGAEMGASMAPLADANGDGFADWIVASPGAVGRVFVLLGGGGRGKRHETIPMDLVNGPLFPPARSTSQNEIFVGHFPHAPMGRTMARFEVEVRTQNERFTGAPTFVTPFDRAVGFPSDKESSIGDNVVVPLPGRGIHLRARIRTRSPWFQRSTWSAFGGRVSGDHDVRFAGTAVAVDPGDEVDEGRPRLLAVAPNPARGGTVSALSFAIPRAAHVTLEVFDVRGTRVRNVADATFAAGTTTLRWDGRDERGRVAPAGLYFVALTADGRLVEKGRLVRLP